MPTLVHDSDVSSVLQTHIVFTFFARKLGRAPLKLGKHHLKVVLLRVVIPDQNSAPPAAAVLVKQPTVSSYAAGIIAV